MKWIVLILLLIFGCNPIIKEDMAVYVPDTNTFCLDDVIDAVEDHAGNISNDLDACFDYSIPEYFDPSYNCEAYAPAFSMKRFRNYGPGQGCEIFVPDGFSPNGDGVHDYFEVAGLWCYEIHRMSIFAPTGGCNCGITWFNGGELIYRRTNDYDYYPWDGTYQGGDCPNLTSYPWTLEIDNKYYDDGYVLISR